MKRTNLLKVLLVFSCLVTSVSCGETNSSSTQEQGEQQGYVFENKTVTYDGNVHSVEVTNLPAGATVKYTGNDKVEPGLYTVRAKITFADGTNKTVSAKLTIEKIESVLTADAVQEAFAYGGVTPSYSLNNTVQQIKLDTVYRPGTYTYDLYAPETEYYKESNHIQVTFTVKEGNNLGVKFQSKEVVYDGTPQQLVAENVPEGYSVEYVNNVATEQGKNNATCKVKDASGNVVLTLNAFLTIDNTENQEFKALEDELFLEYFGDDCYAWNVFTEKPEDFGFVRGEGVKASWYTYEKFDIDEFPEYYEFMVEWKERIEAFGSQKLSFAQRTSYETFIEFFNEQIEYYSPESNFHPLMNSRYIDRSGGNAADFTSTAEEYILRREQDVIDLLDLFESLPAAFESYYEYGQDKIEAGYPISDYTIDEMVQYLDKVVGQGDDYYLEGVICRNIDKCDFLSAEVKEAYKAELAEAFDEYFFPSFAKLADDLKTLKGHCTTEGYLSSYGDIGKKYYKYSLQYLLGLHDMDFEAYKKELESSITKASSKIDAVLSAASRDSYTYSTFVGYVNNGYAVTGLTDPYDMLEYLKEFANTIVTPLEKTPEIVVKYMDEAVGEISTAVAYYKKSALDGGNTEYITLNPVSTKGNYNDLLLTMAHEGYPGHLYEYNYNKQQDYSNFTKVATSTAHGEGWAMYVELKLLEYMKTHHSQGEKNQAAVEALCDYLSANVTLGYAAYAYLDYMIHMEGWKENEIFDYFGQLGFNTGAVTSVYKTLVEIPTTYAAYGYGIVFMSKIHGQAQVETGKYYDEVEFNKAIMAKGWCNLGTLQELTDEYISDTLFQYTID